jgi:arylsulfatase A-like enzyme
MRRALLLALGLSLALLSAPAAAQSEVESPSPEPREEPPASPSTADLAPDIVVVVVDDLGFLPREQVLERLPAVRELWLDGGLRFTEMHDESPLCSPSRANLLTGRHTLAHGVPRNEPSGLDDSRTIAVALDEAGYRTMLVGKYLNHYDGTVVPPGWDHAFIHRTASDAVFWDDGELLRLRGRDSDDVIRQEAVRSLRRAPTDEPLFALVAPGVPHCDRGGRECHIPDVMERDQGARACRAVKPFRPPTYTVRTNRREVREMPDWPRGWRLTEVCEAMQVVDRTVRQLVAAQAERGRDAYFVFLSDNGMAWGQHGFSLKHTPPSTRSPFLVAGPDVAPGETAALSSMIDVAPTLAELAGTDLPWADGVSLAPLLRAPVDARASMSGRTEHLEVMPASSGYVGWSALRTPEWRFVRWDDGRRELYDLVADPWQARNRIRREPEVAAEMEARLDELLSDSAGSAGSAESASPSASPMLPAASATPAAG